MACYYCRHFNEIEKGEPDWELGAVERVTGMKGNCCISPQWAIVTGLHYCSQFSPAQPRFVVATWLRMHEYGDAAREAQARAKTAEAKLKEVRAQLREVRGRTPKPGGRAHVTATLHVLDALDAETAPDQPR